MGKYGFNDWSDREYFGDNAKVDVVNIKKIKELLDKLDERSLETMRQSAMCGGN